MRESAPENLVALLERLHLADGAQVRGVHGQVRRLARDLPRFESVWVDALAQSRILTPFQATEINAGRGESLRIGPYLLCQSLAPPGYAASYLAREIKSRQMVRLTVVETSADEAGQLAERLEKLAAQAKSLAAPLSPVTHAGAEGNRVWAVSRHTAGRTAGERLTHDGRFFPNAVLQIARQMLAGLVQLERVGLCHGDLSVWNLLLTDRGEIVLPEPGLRGMVRPEEGHAHADLQPEYYDYLAPERVVEGSPPTAASDIYACGCVWWHLLAGRAPLPGGNTRAKLRAVEAAEILDVRRLAPETPPELARAVTACLQREPSRRPESMARLATLVGAPTVEGRRAVARSITPTSRNPAWTSTLAALYDSKRMPFWLTLGAVGLIGAAMLAGSMWQRDSGMVHPAVATVPNAPPVRPARPSEPALPDKLPASVEPAQAAQPPVGKAEAGTAGVSVRQRTRITVPPEGLVVQEENARFENTDFVWEPGPTAAQAAPSPAIVRLQVSRAEFSGCSFQTTSHGTQPPTAIAWTHPVGQAAEVALPSGRVQLSDCVLRRVGAGIRCQTVGAIAVEATNTLHLGTGPLILLNHCPKIDEPVAIGLSSVTLRDSGPLLECHYDRIEDQPGRITVQAVRSAFASVAQGALLSFVGPRSPERLLASIEWTGQGSLISPEMVVARWQKLNGGGQTLDDTSVSIAGLVRSAVGFAGPADASPAASGLIRWQAPLHSASPPGIDPNSLAW